MRAILFLVLILAALLAGCAHGPAPVEAMAGSPLTPLQATPAPAPTSAAPTGPDAVKTEVGLPDRGDLVPFKTIEIQLAHAQVKIAGNHPKKKGTLRVELLAGEPECEVILVENAERLVLTEAEAKGNSSPARTKPVRLASVDDDGELRGGSNSLPGARNGGGCQFGIEMALPKAGDLDIVLRRGHVDVEAWNRPVRVRMDWGDIDISSVADFQTVCGDCTLTGSGVEGLLRYEIGSGNVGVDGLTGGVEGATLGDTILKWRRLKTDSKIKVLSRAGDVILSFPSSIPLAMDLKVPRGEIYSGLAPRAQGTLLDVTVEQGSLRLLKQ